MHTGKFISLSHFNLFLQRDAKLAWYILWHCVRLSVRLCLSLSVSLQVGVVLKRLDIGSQNHTIAQGVLFSGGKDLSEIAPWGADCRCGGLKSVTFDK